MGRGETVIFDGVEAIKETGLALLCRIDGAEVWMPKSQIADDSQVTEEGDHGVLVVTEWIAIEKGLV